MSSEPHADRVVSATDRRLVWVLLAACLVAGATTTVDPDMLHRLALARETLARGQLPLRDPFSFTPTRHPVVDHEWLTGIILHAITSTTGAAGLLVTKYALHGLTLGLALALARRLGASMVVLGFLGPLGIAMTLPGMTTIRAQAFTLAFTAATLFCFDLDRRGGRAWIAGFVALCILWVNCHGGWVVAPGLLVLHAIEQWLRGARVRHLVVLAALLPLVTLATPYGLAYPPFLAEAVAMDRSMVAEWRRLGEWSPLALPVWALSLLVFVYGWLPAGPRAVPGWLLVVATSLLAYRHERHVSLYGLVWLAHVPSMIEHVSLGRTFRTIWFARPLFTRAFVLLGIVVAALHAFNARRWEIAVPNDAPDDRRAITFPVGAVEYLRSHEVTGRVTTPFEQGSYVTWKLFPAVAVSLDSRFEVVYTPALVREHVAFYAAHPTWRDFLARHPSDLVLARRSDAIVAHLRTAGEWSLVYEDDGFLLFARPGIELPYADRRRERIAGTFP